ncbi:ATP-binding protein [Subtercola vilae]|uniref:ATP-binding protein n=1 Tax=Subtercola vilae TaxID=2056433 RepID=A0A4T2C0H2_9MICO|nr:ATP-binding protein [Subtercola vilae]TIH37169.1 ATP-binding protein [Subtercola vilae]
MPELIERNLLPFAREAQEAFPVLVIQGGRQVGKSTFAQRLAQGRESRLFTLDNEASLDAARADPRGFVDQNPAATIVIDEVQRAPGLILAVKASVDRDRRPGRFILTGSLNLLRLERTPDSLAGRAVTVALHGFSQDELARRRGDFASAVRQGARFVDFATTWQRNDYVEALSRGSYPEAQGLSGRLRNVWLDSYLSRILQRDAVEIRRDTQPARLDSVMRLLAANQSGELVKARIAAQANIPASSIGGYLDLLETLFLIATLPPWTPNLTKREVGRAKAIVNDSALAVRLSRLTENQLKSFDGSDHLGALIEGLVVQELMKQSGWSDEEFELFHYRDRNGVEVDVVIEFADGSVFGVEVKAGKTFKAEHFSGLSALAARAGERFLGGVVLNTSDQGYQFSRGLYGLPISALWEL